MQVVLHGIPTHASFASGTSVGTAHESSEGETSAVTDIGTVNIGDVVIRPGNPFAFRLRPSPLRKILRRSCPSPYEMGRSSTPGTFQRAIIFSDRFVMSRFHEPRGRSREEAAAYIGVGVTKFDAMVTAGRMPQPRAVDRRRIWCVRELDAAFDLLPKIEATEQPGAASIDWQDLAH